MSRSSSSAAYDQNPTISKRFSSIPVFLPLKFIRTLTLSAMNFSFFLGLLVALLMVPVLSFRGIKQGNKIPRGITRLRDIDVMQLFVTAITTTVATAFLAKSESALRNQIVAGQVIANKDAEIARKDALAHREETRNLLLNSSRDTNVKMDKLSNDLDKLSNDVANLTASMSKKRWW